MGYKFYDQLEQVLGYEALSIDVFDDKDDQEQGMVLTSFEAAVERLVPVDS